MHVDITTVFGGITTVTSTYLLYKLNRRDNKAAEAAKISKESNDKLISIETRFEILASSLTPLPQIVERLDEKQNRQGEKLAVLDSEFNNFRREARENIRRLDQKTFYNGGQT